MDKQQLATTYRDYIECLNGQDWANLGRYVAPDVRHNGRTLGRAGYQAMLESDFRAIPDLRFVIDMLICDPPRIASRLMFDCTPVGLLFDIPVNGKRVRFAEHVFYEFGETGIGNVWSLIDKTAIAAQI